MQHMFAIVRHSGCTIPDAGLQLHWHPWLYWRGPGKWCGDCAAKHLMKKNQVIIISSPSVVQNDSYHAHGIYHIYMIYRYIYIDQIDLDVFNSKWYGHMAFCRFWKVEKTVNKDFLLQYLAQFGGDLPTQLECEAWINSYFSHFGPEFSTYFFIDPPHGWPRQLFAKLRWLKASTLLLLQQDSCRPGGVFRVKIDYVCGFKFI